MKKTVIALLALLLLALPAQAQEMVLDVSGIWQRSTGVDDSKINDFDVQTSFLVETLPGVRIGFQGVMGSLGDISDGGIMAAWELPVVWQPNKAKPWELSMELLGWLNQTEETFDIERGAFGIGVLFSPNPADPKAPQLTVKLARGGTVGTEVQPVTRLGPEGAVVVAFEEVEIAKHDFVLTFGVRLGL